MLLYFKHFKFPKKLIISLTKKMVETSAKPPLQEFLKNKPAPLIDGPEPDQDISFQWVKKNEELKLIEDGIAFDDFAEAINQRNLEMEFRVIFLHLNPSMKLIFQAHEKNDGKHLPLSESEGFRP